MMAINQSEKLEAMKPYENEVSIHLSCCISFI
jgi:hypothetical protein